MTHFKHKDNTFSIKDKTGNIINISENELAKTCKEIFFEKDGMTMLERELLVFAQAYQNAEDFEEAIIEKAEYIWNTKNKKRGGDTQ